MVKFIISVLQAQGGDRGRRATLGLVVEEDHCQRRQVSSSQPTYCFTNIFPARKNGHWRTKHERGKAKTVTVGEGEL